MYAAHSPASLIQLAGCLPTGSPPCRLATRGEGAWCIDNADPLRWLIGEPALVRYDPGDQFAMIIDPETLENI